VSPRALRRHQQAMQRLAGQVEEQLPESFEVVVDFEVLVRAEQPVILRAPDLVVRADTPQQRAPVTS
jgi:hypothetical protein